MVIDTSAIMAVLLAEPRRPEVLRAIADAPSCVIAAPTRVELTVALRHTIGSAAERRSESWLKRFEITTETFTAEHTAIAIDGFRDYGRGSGHPARLNFGDCFSYALAIAREEPLLFVGDDFTHTDVQVALQR
ncbi:type II toxin-antitoxin system VapC family toxin [uncultured Demequina sp.]|uniref:type II toxin-antitoxin system VapC family toxin n=1 Tax=uncultured Demequina sp. TaxID=693499 RepID=UPI0025EBDD17|nr:type II toxin-antitoxin system VapC family toxin [uncultured Demequina sp.]